MGNGAGAGTCTQIALLTRHAMCFTSGAIVVFVVRILYCIAVVVLAAVAFYADRRSAHRYGMSDLHSDDGAYSSRHKDGHLGNSPSPILLLHYYIAND